MTDVLPPRDEADVARQAARFTRLLTVLRRQHRSPEVMAEFFTTVGAHGVVTALATVAFGPRREDLAGGEGLPELLRDGLHAASAWPEFDAEGFGADLAELLRDQDEDGRATVSAVTSYLLASGRYDARLLAGWSRAFDELALPAASPVTWSSFLTGTDGPRPWEGLAAVAHDVAHDLLEHRSQAPA